MFKVIELEKVQRKERQTVLYSGDSARRAEFVRFQSLRPYHKEKTEKKDGCIVFFLIVD